MNRSIIEAILKITGTDKLDPVFYVNCTVDSVDLSTRSCVCTMVDGLIGSTIPGVMLMAVVDDGILIEPVIGSIVKVIFSNNVEPFIAQFSEVRKITLTALEGIVLNDGSEGGLVKATTVQEKLNNLEDDLNNLKKAFTDWVVVPADGGAALKAIAATWAGQEITKTELPELENPAIKHGI